MAESRRANRLPRFLIMALLVLMALYGLAGFLLLPWWLERVLPEQLGERMGWQAEVADISVNPFNLTVTALELSARDGEDARVLGFDELVLDLHIRTQV